MGDARFAAGSALKRSEEVVLRRVVRLFLDKLQADLAMLTRAPTVLETGRRSLRWCEKHPGGCYERWLWKQDATERYGDVLP